MIFNLRETTGADINGNPTTHKAYLKKQTDKALLLAISHKSANGEREVCYWMPKSRVTVTMAEGKEAWGEIDLAAAKKIEIPEWLWEKRQAV